VRDEMKKRRRRAREKADGNWGWERSSMKERGERGPEAGGDCDGSAGPRPERGAQLRPG
jgi:hypothetical protein